MADSATAVLQALKHGALSSQAHVQGLLSTIEQLEPDVQAWAHLDPALALQQARQADERRAAGDASPLLGVGIGLKDIIDTTAWPTENGTVLHRGRRPAVDADLVQRLRVAGAVVMGKTVTTELATYAPGKTRNPHRLTHTPGGSSSGSAAAVACGMVPLAIGTQTNGSVIRPGAFCGVVSFKPTRSTIGRRGVLVQSPTFDTIGLFARTVQDVSLLWGVLAGGADGARAASAAAGEGAAVSVATADVLRPDAATGTTPAGLRLVWLPGPLRERLEPGMEAALATQARAWGATDGPADLPVSMAAIIDLHRVIMEAEIARSFHEEYERGADELSASLRGQIERGRTMVDTQLEDLQGELLGIQAAVDEWMQLQGIDGWITASAPGTAPPTLSHTGDPVFCTLGTALDLPALQLPALKSSEGLPLGIQLVGRRGSDASLLRKGMRLYA